MADANQASEPTSPRLDGQELPELDHVRRAQSVPLPSSPPLVTVNDHSGRGEGDGSPKSFLDKFKKKQSWLHSKVDWEPWRKEFETQGRVLVIDYVRHENTPGRVLAKAYEFADLEALRIFYADKRRCQRTALRFVHVQNATWASRFLMRKYNLNPRDHVVGMSGFANWLKYDRPEWRAGKPLLKAKAWKTERDPWRAVSRTAMGCDYLRPYETAEGERRGAEDVNMHDSKMMELNAYDENDESRLGYDVHVQRFSCYIQYADGIPLDPSMHQKSPYDQDDQDNGKLNGNANGPARRSRKQPHPRLEDFDNSTAMVVFEQSNSSKCKDTLIQAQNQLESRWRRLSLYLTNEQVIDDTTMTLHCMDYILSDIFKALSYAWEQFLSSTDSHVSILEDKIYANPADESRAEEIWLNAKNALRVEKLVYLHISVAKAMTIYMQNLPIDEEDGPNGWLEGTNDEFQRLAELVQEGLMKPVTSLNDLMYKSVGIRDARQSLQLGLSMWRLSWVTFIFLPLSVLVGFFGMNVDTFQNNPSIKWYFIAAVPLMLAVLIGVYALKHQAYRWRRTPYQRGIYEHFFHELALKYPALWTRAGPRKDVQPSTTLGALKWRLLKFWFDPRRTIYYRRTDEDDDGSSDLGTWAYIKRSFARSWLLGMRFTHVEAQAPVIEDSEMGYLSDPNTIVASGSSPRRDSRQDGNIPLATLPPSKPTTNNTPFPPNTIPGNASGAITELALLSQPVFAAEAAPLTSTQLADHSRARLSPVLRGRISEHARRSSAGSPRPGTGRASSDRNSSGAMIDERDLSDYEPVRQVPRTGRYVEDSTVLNGVGAWG